MKTEHHFASTGEAYDACQCDENIKDGDVLVIESERVVGVADTWPVAVTVERGALHALADESSVEAMARTKPALVEGWDAAVAVAERLGFAVRAAKRESGYILKPEHGDLFRLASGEFGMLRFDGSESTFTTEDGWGRKVGTVEAAQLIRIEDEQMKFTCSILWMAS